MPEFAKCGCSVRERGAILIELFCQWRGWMVEKLADGKGNPWSATPRKDCNQLRKVRLGALRPRIEGEMHVGPYHKGVDKGWVEEVL